MKKADDVFKEAGIPFYTLSNYNELIEVAREEGKISEEDIQTLVDWRQFSIIYVYIKGKSKWLITMIIITCTSL